MSSWNDSYDYEYVEPDEEEHRKARGRRESESSQDDWFIPPPDLRAWESQAEREFAHFVHKYLAQAVTLIKGVNVKATIGRHQFGPFRPDMLLESNGRTIGLEVDGRDFHKDKERDGLRDSALIAGRIVSAIYRFSASATLFSPTDCLYMLARYEPSMFSIRAREELLPRLASKKVLTATFARDGAIAAEPADSDLTFDGDLEPNLEPRTVSLTRITSELPIVARTVKYIERALELRPGITPLQLLDHYRPAIARSRLSWRNVGWAG